MRTKNKCLVLICNPKLDYTHGAGIGSILAAKAFADKKGAVFWNFGGHVKKNKLKVLYFYDVTKKMITHRADIKIFDSEEVSPREEKYFPSYRKSYFSIKGWTAIKMKNIKELEKPLSPKKFGVHISTGNFRYGNDINPRTKTTKTNFKTFADHAIFNCLLNGFEEKDIEDMLFTFGLVKNKIIKKEKLPHDQKFDRYDIFYRNSKGQPILIEIKKDTANKETLKQLKGYMRSLQRKEKRLVRGIILCREPTPELEKLVKKEKYIKIQQFRFSIDFGNLMDD